MRQPCLAMFAVWYIMTVFLNYVLADEILEPSDHHCYRAEHKECPANESTCLLNNSSMPSLQMLCCNLSSVDQIDKFLKDKGWPRGLTGIHIRDSNFNSLDLKFFDAFNELASLSITDSKIARIGGEGFQLAHPVLTCLDLSDNVLPEFSSKDVFTKLVGLKKLVIANNTNMTTLPFLPVVRTFIELDVSNNRVLECKSLINITEFKFYKKVKINQLSKNATICAPPARYFGTTVEVQMHDIDQVAEIYRNCPVSEDGNCTCIVASLEGLENQKFVYHASVNCSGLRLTSLPKILPPFTSILDVSNNRIRSLDGISNRTYGSIKTLFADHNFINSLKPLEGTLFLENFQNLSLTNNNIDHIPLHILTNAFDRTGSGRRVLLSKNTLKCGCITATEVKNWLQSVSESIPDFEELIAICNGAPIRVVDMIPKDYCPANHLQFYLRFVIGVEVTAFILLIAKVSYDYYIFKTAGYLPWPASKMPKLPCDLCFDT